MGWYGSEEFLRGGEREKIVFIIWSFGFVISTTYRISFDSVLRVGGRVRFFLYIIMWMLYVINHFRGYFGGIV